MEEQNTSQATPSTPSQADLPPAHPHDMPHNTAHAAHYPRNEAFKFTGDGGDYFGIWFVNTLLSWLTLGIYSAWAKVRTLQYFYGNTEIAGGRFHFTASPLVILRSRVIAVALLALYLVVSNVQTSLAKIVLVVLVGSYFVFAPILAVFAMSFRLRYSEWRGISFRFNRDYAGAYRVYLAPILLLGLISASFLLPVYSSKVEDFFGLEPFEYGETEISAGCGQSADDSNETGEAGEISETSAACAEAPLFEENQPDNLDEYHSEAQDEIYSDYENQEEGEETYQEDGYQVDNDQDEYSEAQSADDELASDDSWQEEDSESDKKAYVNPWFFIPAGVLFLGFLALLPWFDFINTRFISRNVRLGRAPFTFVATARDYYRFYGAWFVATFALMALWISQFVTAFIGGAVAMWALGILTFLYIPASRAYLKSRRYSVLLNNTIINGQHRLQGTTTFGGMLALMLTNSLVLILSLGFALPWTQIRSARYLLQNSALTAAGSLDDFVAAQQNESTALAEEVADIFDLDIIG